MNAAPWVGSQAGLPVSAPSEGWTIFLRADDDMVPVNAAGEPMDLHGERLRWIMPFHGGRAACCHQDGRLGHLDRTGRFVAGAEPEEWRLRLGLCRIAGLIYERRYNASIDGNISVRLPDGNVLITPSGAHNAFLQPDRLVVMDLHGETVRGPGRASSEKVLHLEIYAHRPDIQAVIHAHAPNAIAASIAGLDLMEMVATMAPIPTAAYAQPSSPESAERMRPFLEGYDWGVLPRHGVVTMGTTPWSAFLRLESLEHYAGILLKAHASGQPITPLEPHQRQALLDSWDLGPFGERKP